MEGHVAQLKDDNPSLLSSYSHSCSRTPGERTRPHAHTRTRTHTHTRTQTHSHTSDLKTNKQIDEAPAKISLQFWLRKQFEKGKK